ncbi:FAD-dependent oxidoreductase [Amycolatopsis sp. PS_44_ISF1]|uniref:NAD(P)/FAD-dependent oxidoreductase n=1 Tax=Amycolatopsis sp. PS_44_ISF1 TaxID=2974917 RepID=UPI0028E02ACD|nr:FAD-dependent oxidoreductase [Amycolatopsis sp. PS_44_ISF1]MDT8912357.1 FAD-binding oxidoreductase [Amycolatopsis sp. PS_44_ISF1]
MTTADVLVAGAGVVGASIAFHLAGRGVRVVVCDEGGGRGATAWSAGQVRLAHSDPADARLAALSLPVFERWAEAVGGDCGFRATGFALLVDEDRREAAVTTVKELDALGAEAVLLTPEEYARRRPGLRTDGVAAVLFEPRSGYADPGATTRSLLERAAALGAEVRTGARIDRLIVRGGAVRGGRVGDEVVSAAEVVLAANTGGPALLEGTGVEVPLTTARIGWAAVQAADLPQVDVTIDDTIGTYFRPWRERGVLYRVPMGDRTGGPAGPELLDHARSLVAQRVPVLAGHHATTSGAALETHTPDGKPVFGRAGVPGLYLALGPSGGGFKSAPAVGRAVAAELDGAGPAGELEPYRLARFTGAPRRAVRHYRHM